MEKVTIRNEKGRFVGGYPIPEKWINTIIEKNKG